jgi:hypothetical protein
MLQSHNYLKPFKVIAASIVDFLLPVARDVIGSSTVGFLDLRNRGMSVGISFLRAIELEICMGSVETPTPSGLR